MYKTESFQIKIWLVSLMTIILLMIIVGGLTRLTESGLSMVDWKLFVGTIPPLSDGDWLKVFDDYKQYPEYQIKNVNMTLSEFKYIFWWEYGHRVLGRIIGIIFIVPFVCSSNPAINLSRVLFPHPECPSMDINSPLLTLKLTSFID